MDDHLAFASASTLTRLIESRQIGCVELLDLFVRRIEKYNAALNAVISNQISDARQKAAQCDTARAKGERIGPLHGLPMTVKESFDVAGLATTWGVPEFKGNIAKRPATVVSRFESAGAIVFGKTNIAANLADWQSFNPVYGCTNNPWDVTRSPGGSSGGSAAALAAGLTALEVGSDIGGSIRNPAHYCGIYGHRPTFGVVPQTGHGLPDTYSHGDLNVIGPLARSAEDLTLALQTIAGPEDAAARAWSLQLPEATAKPLSRLRIRVNLSAAVAEVDRSIQDGISRLAEWLAQHGAQIEHGGPPADEALLQEMYILLLRAGTSRRLTEAQRSQLLQDRAASEGRHDYFALQARGNTISHWEWLKWDNLRHQFQAAWHALFNDIDFYLCPAAATAAVPHNHVGPRWERMIDVNGQPQPSTTQMYWAGLAVAANLPATVAPIGATPEGLPIGVQIIGAPYQDLSCIHFAGMLERDYYGFHIPPAFAPA